jgi:hypothetical protein
MGYIKHTAEIDGVLVRNIALLKKKGRKLAA